LGISRESRFLRQWWRTACLSFEVKFVPFLRFEEGSDDKSPVLSVRTADDNERVEERVPSVVRVDRSESVMKGRTGVMFFFCQRCNYAQLVQFRCVRNFCFLIFWSNITSTLDQKRSSRNVNHP
jgi:hypothetical protein